MFGQRVTERIGATADAAEPPVQPGWFKTLIFIYSDSRPVTERAPSVADDDSQNFDFP